MGTTRKVAAKVAGRVFKFKAISPGNGAGARKVRAGLETAFSRGIRLPYFPDAAGPSYPAACIALGCQDLRDAGIPLYVPSTDSWIGAPVKCSGPKAGSYFDPKAEDVKAVEYRASMATQDANSGRTNSVAYLAKHSGAAEYRKDVAKGRKGTAEGKAAHETLRGLTGVAVPATDTAPTAVAFFLVPKD